jgi:tRNA-dihydrouridine synthase
VPVTGKIRLGWDDQSRNYLEIAHVLEDNGASAVAIHGRTKQQAYKGEADWNPIGEIKAAVKIPVIGNGDVKRAADIERIKAQTGCDAVMIGRAAIGNPWIFQRKIAEVTLPHGPLSASISPRCSIITAAPASCCFASTVRYIRGVPYAAMCASPVDALPPKNSSIRSASGKNATSAVNITAPQRRRLVSRI